VVEISRREFLRLGGMTAASLVFAGLGSRQASATMQQAKMADKFVDSIGVMTHQSYFNTAYGNYQAVSDKLVALGVRHARDSAVLSSDANYNRMVYNRFKGLANRGVRYNLIVDPRSLGLANIDRAKMDSIIAHSGGALEAVEGPNEFDLSGGTDWADRLRAYQRSLYQSVKASSKPVPVLAPSLVIPSSYDKLGDMSAYCDFGNTHPYPGGRNPGTSGWGDGGYGSLSWNAANARKVCATKPIIATETGYHNVPGPLGTNSNTGVPEDVSGKYIPRLFLHYYDMGLPRAYAYEMVDFMGDPSRSAPEKHWGLLRSDYSAKPAYVALKNLIGLLSDPGPSFAPGSLDYSLSGDLTNVRQMLFQKRDGRFYLVLWQEVLGYDVDKDTYIPVARRPVTLKLSTRISRAAIYEPNRQATPLRSRLNPTELRLRVPDQVVVVRLTPK
jgi:hypothetical protein